jgi:hypothetical protein
MLEKELAFGYVGLFVLIPGFPLLLKVIDYFVKTSGTL